MPTILTARNPVTTILTPRDPIGIEYLVDENGEILTDEFGDSLYASQTNTQHTSRPQITSPGGFFKIGTGFLKINPTDKLKTQADYPYTLYSSRPII